MKYSIGKGKAASSVKPELFFVTTRGNWATKPPQIKVTLTNIKETPTNGVEENTEEHKIMLSIKKIW